MSLPATFLTQAENHGCFSGCFGHYARFDVCLDPVLPSEEMLSIYCRDCLGFKIGALKSLLPAGVDGYWLADQLSDHNRKRRGYAWSVSGYHNGSPGFWLSAAYYAQCGVFLLNGSHSRSLGSDLDLLMLAFHQGVLAPSHPQMTDTKQYLAQEVHLDMSAPLGPVWSAQDILTSPQCRTKAGKGYQRVTVAEFLPISTQAQPTLTFAAPATIALDTDTEDRDSLDVGDMCPICGAAVRERPLFTGSYIGCLCD